MTLRDVIENAKTEYLNGTIIFFRPTVSKTCYSLGGYKNKYKGEPIEWYLNLHLGMHTHYDKQLTVFEATQDWEVCEGVK